MRRTAGVWGVVDLKNKKKYAELADSRQTGGDESGAVVESRG